MLKDWGWSSTPRANTHYLHQLIHVEDMKVKKQRYCSSVAVCSYFFHWRILICFGSGFCFGEIYRKRMAANTLFIMTGHFCYVNWMDWICGTVLWFVMWPSHHSALTQLYIQVTKHIYKLKDRHYTLCYNSTGCTLLISTVSISVLPD